MARSKSSDILLSLEHHRLKVGKNTKGEIYVHYEDGSIAHGIFVIGEYGVGPDFESACADYLEKIRGKTLVFDYGDRIERVKILG